VKADNYGLSVGKSVLVLLNAEEPLVHSFRECFLPVILSDNSDGFVTW
jgi:hypothetical protein